MAFQSVLTALCLGPDKDYRRRHVRRRDVSPQTPVRGLTRLKTANFLAISPDFENFV